MVRISVTLNFDRNRVATYFSRVDLEHLNDDELERVQRSLMTALVDEVRKFSSTQEWASDMAARFLADEEDSSYSATSSSTTSSSSSSDGTESTEESSEEVCTCSKRKRCHH